ncbi:hypothetical protein TURU_013810 [Turdus rufiventris]|nr:hypothetical protein TURU_013810 [Turdus rufiventris]
MGEEQEVEATVMLESYDLVVITDTWWDEATIDGYRLLKRDRRGRRGGGVDLFFKKCIDYEEMSPENSHEQDKSLWVRIRDRGNKGNLAGVYYRLPSQGEPIDKAFLLQLQETSYSQGLILLRDFNYPDICWESSTVSCRQSRRLLECMEDNFFEPDNRQPYQRG